MEKYGFVYIWYNSWKKKYYVGCHWGTEDDGYICSSHIMNKSYKRTPQHFKRRIIARIYDRSKLLEEEHKWLSLIKDKELGRRYYNISKRHFGHWSAADNELLIREKISIKTKEAMSRPEVRANMLEGLKNRDTRSSDLDVREKRRKSMIGKNVGKDNSKAIAAAKLANTGRKLSSEHRAKIKATTVFKSINSVKHKCKHCGAEMNIGHISRYHNDKCKMA